MRHRKKGRTLGRQRASRKALLRSLATNFMLNESMQTTVAKAKEVQPLIERLITKGKDGSLANRRQLLKVLYSEKAVNKVIDDISPRYVERPGGYTRITKLGFRQGDGAPIAQIELI